MDGALAGERKVSDREDAHDAGVMARMVGVPSVLDSEFLSGTRNASGQARSEFAALQLEHAVEGAALVKPQDGAACRRIRMERELHLVPVPEGMGRRDDRGDRRHDAAQMLERFPDLAGLGLALELVGQLLEPAAAALMDVRALGRNPQRRRGQQPVDFRFCETTFGTGDPNDGVITRKTSIDEHDPAFVPGEPGSAEGQVVDGHV